MTIAEILIDVSDRLRQAGVDHAIGGSLASSVWGDPRSTNDIDIGVQLRSDQIPSLVAAFPDPYYVSENELREAIRDPGRYRTSQLLHMDEALKVDLFLVRDDEYTRSEFGRRRYVSLGAASIPYLAPENILIQKLRWFDEGNRVSDRQWNDIVRIIDVQGPQLDVAYLSKWAEYFQLEDLLRKALAQSER